MPRVMLETVMPPARVVKVVVVPFAPEVTLKPGLTFVVMLVLRRLRLTFVPPPRLNVRRPPPKFFRIDHPLPQPCGSRNRVGDNTLLVAWWPVDSRRYGRADGDPAGQA